MTTTFFNQFDPQRVRDQYAANALQLREMEKKAIANGGKHRGTTAQHLSERADYFERMSKLQG